MERREDTVSMPGRQEGDDRSRLHQRLRRLSGERSTRRKKKSTPVPSSVAGGLGKPVNTPSGPAYLIEQLYTQDYEHGSSTLGDLLRFEPAMAARVAQDPGLGELEPRDLIFLDTETTGLAGGAGTLVFLVGLGQFTPDGFQLRQYFLRDPAQEHAMLLALQSSLEGGAAFVTFNGRTFDLPLLEMRYQIAVRLAPGLTARPHLDLLYPSRRLWRRALTDCRLGTLEKEVLGVERTEDDVPGALIPGMYLDYLRSGDLRDMERVVYHNAVDILSLVALTGEVLTRHKAGVISDLSGAEALGIARWHQNQGHADPAEAAFRAALESGDDKLRLEALRHFSAHLKRLDRRTEAIEHLEQWHALDPGDPHPCIELAKYYEWHAHELELAKEWAEKALLCLSHWPPGWRTDQMWGEIQHRIERTNRKIDARDLGSTPGSR
jgi:uncharacterized protein YprB with RNaseH-like and TPR domain